MVRLIKKDDPANITLAIGDGANDVSMILEADIGIGIFGKEGVRAAQSADYAIHKFKYLWTLVFYHGRYNYIRISELILYFFYKNILFTIPQLFFAFVSDYSAQTVFEDYYISFYNLFFTALPIGAKSLFEKDIDYRMHKDPDKQDDVKSLYPHLYYVGQRSLIFTIPNYVIWTGSGILQSLMVFLVSHFAFDRAIISGDGYNEDLWLVSITRFTAIIVIVNMRLMVTSRWFNGFNLACIFLLSMLLYYAYTWVADSLSYSKTYKTSQTLHESPLFYLVVLLCAGAAFAVDLLFETVKVNLLGRPSAFLRRLVARTAGRARDHFAEFQRLLHRNEVRFVEQDLKRERSLGLRRARRMEQLGEALALQAKHQGTCCLSCFRGDQSPAGARETHGRCQERKQERRAHHK